VTKLELEREKQRWKLMAGLCPNCDPFVKLVRGSGLLMRFRNWRNMRKFCPRCGFVLDGE